jgi:hypothetical protein
MKLTGYKKVLNEDYRLMVLVDRDKDDCIKLKHQIEIMFRNAGLVSKSAKKAGQKHQCVCRVVVEEFESWLLGDINALKLAFPNLKVPKKFEQKQPDAITNPSEVLQSLLKNSGYRLSGKIDLARRIGAYWSPADNKSLSFKHFIDGLNFF